MARRRAGLTQRELADRLGCRQATIARWERGDRQASFEDAEAAVSACGLQLDVHLAREDRSWWPQIAVQLELEPLERVRRLMPPGSADLAGTLELLAAAELSAVVVGEVAGALHGWPLVLGVAAVEVCGPRELIGAALTPRIVSSSERGYELDDGGGVEVVERPSGTAGFGDLARGATDVQIGERALRVAGLLDLLRIADASPGPEARRYALAYRAVLDVQRARAAARGRPAGSDEERLAEWLDRQTPMR
jgi:transcriptional regulator with XRE-family HTH domain